MALCVICKKPVFLIPACEDHLEEVLDMWDAEDKRLAKEIEVVEARLASRYYLRMPCRNDLINRYREGELVVDQDYHEWLGLLWQLPTHLLGHILTVEEYLNGRLEQT